MRAPVSILFGFLALAAAAAAPKATFTQNKGQWPEQVLYRAQVPGGVMFVERSAFTYVLFSDSPLGYHGHAHQPEQVVEGKAHAYRVHFEGGQAQAWAGSMQQSQYENYFLGSDSAHWGTGCGVFGEVLLKDVWPGIDLRISGKDGIKYDFIVEAGVDASLIQLKYEGQNALSLKDGAVHVSLSTGEVVEEAPIAFTRERSGGFPFLDGCVVENSDKPAACAYVLRGKTISFNTGAPVGHQLIIDPVLTFASYSGSTGNNFGYTATYDDTGHLYGGGTVFSAGYPLTLGALQNFWAGGTVDVGVSKWSSDGSNLIWSTYYGGNGAEAPHSLVVNAQNELYLLGHTGSSNLPISAGALDPSFNGGQLLNNWAPTNGGYGFVHDNGTDIFVAHFNASATGLIGSTYIGGSGNDGLNMATAITHNYGDHFRGEIALDANGDPVVATSVQSPDMPTTPLAPQTVFGGGGQDGYIFRMNPSLSSLLWGTYFGGTGADNALGIQFDSNGQVFVCGGTTSANIPLAGTPFDPSFNGLSDGYIARFAQAGNPLLSSTYLGTNAYDQSYFVQLDTQDAVYVIGQTLGTYPISPGKYANPGSNQFVHKFQHDLNASLWSTRIGNGAPDQSLSPTAFLVSDCGQIYISGWAGNVNAVASLNSTTTGSPVTPDAYQATTDGSDVYLMVLHPDAVDLYYATFFGGDISAEHVDGGTSRFDKDGTVYHAVCAGCQNNDDFPTTAGAWSNTNNSGGCNLGVFKFELAVPVAEIGIDGPNVICFPSTVQFTNTSSGGDTYLWDFGDGGSSTEFEPAHLYTEEGVFTVSMLMTDSYGCTIADTADIQVIAIPTPVPTIDPVAAICPGASTQLFASDGLSWAWFPSIGVNDTTIADPVVTPPLPMTYSVIIESQCGFDTASVVVSWIDPVGSAGSDTSTCLGSGVALDGSGGGTYAWSPAASLSDPTLANPIASPVDSTWYSVLITTPDGCEVLDTVLVTVYFAPPIPALTDTTICEGTSVQLIAGEAAWYVWHPADGITDLNVQDPIVTPPGPTLYIVDLINPCGTAVDSAFVNLNNISANAWPDTLVCPGQPVLLQASGGATYSWDPPIGLSDPDSSVTTAIAPANTLYTVTVTDAFGCVDEAVVQIDLRPMPAVQAGPDVVIDFGESVQLTAVGEGVLTWSPFTWLNDAASANPISTPEESITYIVTATDGEGCKNTDVLTIIVAGSLYLPNTFTPNGDDRNDTFGAWGKEIQDFELLVFNRWGELIWSTDQIGGRWDGTYKGVESPIDTYVWRVVATEVSGRYHEAIGHVNLVR